MVSGAEILGYKGQEELAGGFKPDGGDNLAEFNRTMSQVRAQNFQWNAMLYQQKIKDRDATAALAAEQDIDVDVLDQDRPLLEKKIDDIWGQWKSTPDIANNREAFSKMQTSIKEFKEMKNSAKVRAVEIKKMQQEYAENPDAEHRKVLGDHIQKQIDGGVLHYPDPFQKMQDFDLDKILANVTPAVVDDPSPVERNGLYYRRTSTKTPLKDFYTYYDPTNMVEGPNKNLPNQIGAFYENASNSKAFMSDQNLNMINKFLDDTNKKEGLTSKDDLFLQPIATRGEDGNWQLSQNPSQVAMDISLLRGYKNDVKEVADDKMQKAVLTRAQTGLANEKSKTEGARRGLLGAQARTQGALANKYNADAEKSRKQGDLAGARTSQILSKGAKPVEEMAYTFNDLYNTKGYKAVEGNLSAEMQRETGLMNGNYEYAPVAPKDPGVVKMLSRPIYDAKGKYVGKQSPAQVIVARPKGGDLNSTIVIGRFTGKGGKQEFVTMDPDRAIGAIIKYDNGFTHDQKTVDLENAARLVVENQQGHRKAGTDLNAIISKLGVVDDGENNQAPAAAPVQAPARAASPVPVIPGAAAPDRKQAIELPPNSVPRASIKGTRKTGNQVQVRIGDKWYNAIGKDATGNILYK